MTENSGGGSARDCCFFDATHWFRYRAAAIIIEDGCVLVAGNEKAPYFYSVGGGVQLGETAEEAVCREVLEETGVAYEIDRLAVVHENFFREEDMAPGKECHEVALYFLMKPRGSRMLHCAAVCGENGESMTWLPVGELGRHRVYPSFFGELLPDLPDAVLHIVSRE